MARTHRGQATPLTTNTIRPYIGGVTGNYVTIRLSVRAAVSGATTVVDRFALPMPFRVSAVQFYEIGGTGTNSMLVRTKNPTYAVDALGTVASSGTLTTLVPTFISTGSLTQNNRTVRRKGMLELEVTNAGGTLAKGAGFALVHGYFLGHVSRIAKYAIPGQSSHAGPVAGFLDVLPLINCKAFTNTLDELGQIVAPYDCKLQAISYSVIGHTLAGAGTQIRLRATQQAQAAPFHPLSDSDIDANTVVMTGGWNGANIVVSGAPIMGSFNSTRTVAKGTTIEIEGDANTGGGDIVPIGSAEALLWVWVQGHIRDKNAEPTVED